MENREIMVRVDVAQGAFDVVQKRSGTEWKMDRGDRADIVVTDACGEERVLSLADAGRRKARMNADGSCLAVYGDFRGVDSSLEVRVLLRLRGEDLDVELDVDDADPKLQFDSLYYPRSFVLPESKKNYWVIPLQGGRLVPSTYRKDIDARLGWKLKLKCHGAVQDRSGMLCLWETPYDVLLGETNSTRTGPKYVPRNMESLGRFRYTRRYTMCFREKTDYAGLIRDVYRSYAGRKGYLVPLAERAREKPRIKDLPGTMMFHQLIAIIRHRKLTKRLVTFEHARKVFEKMVRETGVRKGLYHLDGWCRQGYDALHPDVLPPNDEAGGVKGLGALSKAVTRKGYHFGLHDNYLLYYMEAEQYHDDDAVWDRDLRVFRNRSCTPGGANGVQTPSAARRFVIKNYVTGQNVYRRRWRPLSEYCDLGFCYFDQFLHSGGGHDQDFNPLHPLTRREFVTGMLDVIDIMGKDLGVLTSSEHMYDFAMGHYDINGNSDGVALCDPGEGAVPVPLWNLGLHECMAVTDVDAGPENLVRCGLIGGVLHHRPGARFDYGDDGGALGREVEYIRRAEPLRRLHEEVCFRECTGSRLLSEDGSEQETDFEGIVVRGDTANLTLEISGSRKADGKYDFGDMKKEAGPSHW